MSESIRKLKWKIADLIHSHKEGRITKITLLSELELISVTKEYQCEFKNFCHKLECSRECIKKMRLIDA
jgi:hypothetical protein